MNPLEVLPYDGVFRCLVRSAKNPKRVYLVDLDSWNGVGWCGCYQFAYRLQPQLQRLKPVERLASGDRYRCHHIVAARRVRGEQLLDEIIKQRAENHKRKINTNVDRTS